MTGRLVGSFLALVSVALVAFTIPVAASSAALLRSTLEETATREARLFVPLVLRDDAAAARAIRDRTRDFERATGARVLLARTPDGAVEQVRSAFASGRRSAVWSETSMLGEPAVSVVVPVVEDGAVVAAVRVVASAVATERQIEDIWRFRIAVGVGVVVVSALVAVVLARTLARPVRRLDAVARRMGEGDYEARAEEDGPREVASLARSFNRASRQTAVLLGAQRAFVADASHQLRTPLTAMRLSLDNTREAVGADELSTDELHVRLGALDAEMGRMSRLVEGLLASARAEAPGQARSRLDVSALVLERVALWQASLDDAGLTCLLEVEPDLSVVVTPGAVEQILDNLLDNALTHAPPGGVVGVAVRRHGARIRLVVSDDGPGMEEEQRERAFDRFWRATPRPEGTGLGLAVVKQLVEHDGGRVRLEARRPTGLAAVVELERREESSSRS